MTQDKKTSGQQAGKPAWFELVDSDAPSAQVSKVDKKLPLLALIVTGVIAASGSFFATASGSNQGSNQSMPSVSTNATPAKAVTQSNSTVRVSSPATPGNKLENPAQGGVKAPSGHSEDEDEDNGDDDDEREERD